MTTAETFGRTGFAQFINSPIGRLVRIVIGGVLVAWGVALRGRGAGIALMALGAVPLIAGSLDLCLISAVLGGPIIGARVGKQPPPA
jgi:hypothetical protein